jgi:hypothetical protein
MSIEFMLTEEGVRLLAAFCAQLVRECVPFTIRQDNNSACVTLTGGY